MFIRGVGLEGGPFERNRYGPDEQNQHPLRSVADRSKGVTESAGMDVSYHEDRNANLADEPDKTAYEPGGDHDRQEVEKLDLDSEVVSTTGNAALRVDV